jgi:hypothetical protein
MAERQRDRGDARPAGEGKQREQQAHERQVNLERRPIRCNARDHAIGAVFEDGADVDHDVTVSPR